MYTVIECKSLASVDYLPLPPLPPPPRQSPPVLNFFYYRPWYRSFINDIMLLVDHVWSSYIQNDITKTYIFKKSSFNYFRRIIFGVIQHLLEIFEVRHFAVNYAPKISKIWNSPKVKCGSSC